MLLPWPARPDLDVQSSVVFRTNFISFGFYHENSIRQKPNNTPDFYRTCYRLVFRCGLVFRQLDLCDFLYWVSLCLVFKGISIYLSNYFIDVVNGNAVLWLIIREIPGLPELKGRAPRYCLFQRGVKANVSIAGPAVGFLMFALFSTF